MRRSRYEITLAIALTVALPTFSQAAQNPALPNHALTPGATNPAVTQATIGSTICVVGYTKTIRPPASYTNKLKRTQLDSGYNYQGDLDMRNYEEDHLIPLEIGGSARSVANLWPEPRRIAQGAAMKDKLENKLHLLICSGQITLKAAQQAFAVNWISGYKKYIGAI